MTFLIILVVILILIFILRPYFIKYDTIIAFTGGLGSGKTYLSVEYALKLLRKNRFKVWFHNNVVRRISKIFYPRKPMKPYLERPMLYTSIPVRISKNEYSIILTEGHLLLQDKIIEKSVVFIDEVGSFANQFKYKHPNIQDNFDEFIRLFRHYTKGGYLVVNDQCSENIVLEIRRRINTVFNLMHFRIWFRVIYSVKTRNIHISEEIKTIEENNTEDSYRLVFGIPFFSYKYDTYCYSERYQGTEKKEEKKYNKLKKNKLLKLPEEKYKKNTIDEDTYC